MEKENTQNRQAESSLEFLNEEITEEITKEIIAEENDNNENISNWKIANKIFKTLCNRKK